MTERAHPLDSVVDALQQAVWLAEEVEESGEFDPIDEIRVFRSALQLARQMREAEPVAWGVLCTIRPEGHGPYDAFDQVELDRDAAEYLTTIYTAGANPRVVPLYALPLAPEGAPTNSTEDSES